MDIILHDVPIDQMPLFQELAKALGIRMDQKEMQLSDDRNSIEAALERVANGTSTLKELSWDEFRDIAYGK